MTWCTKCGRTLKRASPSGMGPVCERAMYGSKQRRRAAAPAKPDAAQLDIFAEDLTHALKVDALLGSISLEMPR